MTRYFFHTTNGESHPDERGTELPNLDAVRSKALQSFVEMQQALAPRIWTEGGLRMVINDETGLTLFILELAVINSPAVPSVRARGT